MGNESISFVSREDIRDKIETKSSLLKRALQKIKKGGKALEVTYKSKSELTYIRNIIYTYNKKKGESIKSQKDPDERVVYFYK